MADISSMNLDYERPVKIAEDVWWVGFFDHDTGLHCNPYLIMDGGEAVVIDGGSRPDFPTVMMKILQTGLDPASITALVYHHFDPDLCGSIPNFEEIIDRPDLLLISDAANHMFIRHYSISSRLVSLGELDHSFTFSSGRKLTFFNTPYAHSTGSFVTFDETSGVLFTSDLFGSYGLDWELFITLSEQCRGCEDYDNCPNNREHCHLKDIIGFHCAVMPSDSALRYAMEVIRDIPYRIIAPQHGSVIHAANDIVYIRETLAALSGVGIDGILQKEKACVNGGKLS